MIVYEITDNNDSKLQFIKKSYNSYYMIDIVGLYEINKKDLKDLINCKLHKTCMLTKNKYRIINKAV